MTLPDPAEGRTASSTIRASTWRNWFPGLDNDSLTLREVLATLPLNGESRTQTIDPEAFKLQPGKWTRLEQEVVLNKPGRKDGALRIWVDGVQVIDKSQMMLRENDQVVFGGVQADAHYGGGDPSFASPKDTKIRISPFEVRTP
jgi:hypothetical protein